MAHHGDHTTGTEDKNYDLISVLYHALEGASTYEKYYQDAQQAGDQELAQFFQEVVQQTRKSADRAKELLAKRLSQQPVGAR